MILNKHHFPFVFKDRVEYRKFIDISQIKDIDDQNYWGMSIHYDVPFVHYIPNEIIDRVKNDANTFFIFTSSHESLLFYIKYLYIDLIEKHNVPEYKIIVISDNRDAHLEVERLSQQYNKEKIQVYWSMSCEMTVKMQIGNHRNLIKSVNTLQKKHYDKKFLNYNRRWKIHRPLLVALMCALGLDNKGYISMTNDAEQSSSWPDIFDTLVETINEDPMLVELLNNNKEKIISLDNMYLDTTDLGYRKNRARLVEIDVDFSKTKELYENTYFSLVSETYFFDSLGTFITEKTFKPIAFKHPFIVVSGYRSLYHLKELGYKTFHPYINESYDDEPNNVKRLKMILEEVNRLSNLTDTEVNEFIDFASSIVDHNFNTLTTKQHDDHFRKIG